MYNVAPKDDTSLLTAPANEIYRYEVRIRNIDPVPTSPASAQNRYRLDDHVWVIPPHYRCTSKFQERTVTEVISPQTVIVNSILRHVKDVQPRTNAIPSGGTDDEDMRPQTNAISSGETIDETSDDTRHITMPGQQAAQNGETSELPLQQSTRWRLPMAMHVCDWTKSEACTHLHKRGPQQYKSCAFLSVAVLVLSLPDPNVHFVLLLIAILEEEGKEEDEDDDKTDKYIYSNIRESDETSFSYSFICKNFIF